MFPAPATVTVHMFCGNGKISKQPAAPAGMLPPSVRSLQSSGPTNNGTSENSATSIQSVAGPTHGLLTLAVMLVLTWSVVSVF